MKDGLLHRLIPRRKDARNLSALDRERWETLESNDDWNDRARTVLPFIEGHYPVLDIGSGTQFLRSLVGAENYVSVDSVGAHNADYVVDLNGSSVPQSALQGVRSVTFLGVLEYLLEPEKHLADALAEGRRVVMTYTPTEMVPDLQVREANGWKSHLSLADLEEMLTRLGVEAASAQRYLTQVFLVFGGETPASPPKLAAPSVGKRHKLVISGFFARGNAGDEALLQSIYESFSPHVELICTVDRTGAYEGFWEWYPYNRMEIIHQGELARLLEDDIVGVHVGGGGLPLGFNAAQLTIAGSVGRPLVSTGIDDPLRMLGQHQVNKGRVKQYIESFAAYEVRTRSSLDALAGIVSGAGLGADWAFDLPVDATPSEPVFDGITVVVRELPRSALDPQRQREYRDVFKALDERDIPVRLLPFCPEDEGYLDWIQPAWRYRVERHWWNPRRCKELIAKSRGIISIGRLHPLIFAAEAGTPAVAVDIDTDRFTNIGATSKIADHAREFDMPYFASMSAFLGAIQGRSDLPLGGKAPASYRNRLEQMRAKTHAAFGLG